MVRAISVHSAGVPYAACFTAAVKIPLRLGYVSVLEFVSIESYCRTMDQTKSIELQKVWKKELGLGLQDVHKPVDYCV